MMRLSSRGIPPGAFNLKFNGERWLFCGFPLVLGKFHQLGCNQKGLLEKSYLLPPAGSCLAFHAAIERTKIKGLRK